MDTSFIITNSIRPSNLKWLDIESSGLDPHEQTKMAKSVPRMEKKCNTIHIRATILLIR